MKNFYKQNRVFVILMGIVLICLVVIGSLLLIYFYKGNSKDKYGNRLISIKDAQISKTKKAEIITNIKEEETVEDVTIDIFGKNIYINLTFQEDTKLDVAKGKALAALDNFTEEELPLYDFQITLRENKDGGFLISGAKNNNNPIIVWNNNNDSEEV